MAKSKRRQQMFARKRAERRRRADNPGGDSSYARKRKWCFAHGLWGFEVPEPKPWKGEA